MKTYTLKYKKFGEHSILVECPQIINEKVLNNILLFKSELDKKNDVKIISCKTSYNSLLVTYSDHNNKISELKSFYNEIKISKKLDIDKWEIPVCYETEFGNDLNLLEKNLSLSINKIISIHSAKQYTVYNIGFLPGFLYLGGMDERIFHPRKEKPAMNVEKGSVGIGGSQTGIYPNNSPGGWQIIGKTPIDLFDINRNKPCLVKPGDKINFYSISKKEFQLITVQEKSGIYKLKKTIND